MSYWICCNSCFAQPGADKRFAVSTCGHIICSVCHQHQQQQQGTQGKCLICGKKCKVSPLSDKSSSEVKAFFSDVNVLADKQLTEVSKVIMFQARHEKRLLTHYQQQNEKLEEALVKMKHEMQLMTERLNEQSTYISKLENSLQHQSVKALSMSQRSHGSYIPQGHKPVLQIPFYSPVIVSRHSSSTNVSTDSMEVDERSLFRNPKTAPRLSLINPSHDKWMDIISHRSSNQNKLANRSARYATVSRSQVVPVTPDVPYVQGSGWTSPMFKPPSSFRHSTSTLIFPRP